MIYEECTEDTLLEQWRAGDRSAADELLRRCKPMLAAFFRRRTTENVDELVQRTLVACIQSIANFEGRASFKAFLLGIARNQFLMSLRSNKPREKPASVSTFPEDSPSQLVASKEELRILAAALNATSPPFRQVLKMFYWDDLSVEEIARTLDVPAGTVKSRLGRGRSMIKARIIEAAGPSVSLAKKLVEWMPADVETPPNWEPKP
jgi:RNA polymerase sigma-70 factor (ECF subfamily)